MSDDKFSYISRYCFFVALLLVMAELNFEGLAIIPSPGIVTIEFLEHLSFFVSSFFVIMLFYAVACMFFVLIDCCFELVKRLCYIYKLRKPERIYNGDPDSHL